MDWGGTWRGRVALRAIVVLVVLLLLPAGGAAATGPLVFSAPARIDRAAGLQVPAVTGVSCVSARVCYGVDSAGDVVRFSGGIATGGGQTLYGADPGGGFVGISCPTARLCVGIDARGRVLSTRTPGAGGAWSAVQIGNAGDPDFLTGITCASARLCVLVDGVDPSIRVSTDPTGSARTWRRRADDSSGGGSIPVQVTCPSARVCVESNGSIGYRNPSPGRAGQVACATTRACAIVGRTRAGLLVRWTTHLGHGWHTAVLSSSVTPKSLACPSARLCLIGSRSGQVTRVALPAAAGRPQLAAFTVGSASVTVGSLECPSVNLCLAGDTAGQTFVTSRPATDAGWRLAHTIATRAALLAVTCPSSTECVATDDAGGVLTAPGPAGPWTRQVVDAGHAIAAVACPSATQCFAGDSALQLLASGPAGPSGPWHASTIAKRDRGVANESILSLACPSTALCLAANSDGPDGAAAVYASLDPADTAPTWSPVNVDGENEEQVDDPFVACTAVNACASAFYEVDTDSSSEGLVLSTTIKPASSGDDSWSPVSGGNGSPTAISCGGSAVCVATANTGQVDVGSATTTHRFASATIDPGRRLTGVDCTVGGRCVTVDEDGGVFASDNPTGGASAWRRVATLSGGGQDAIACPTSASCVAVDGQGRAAVGSATG